MITLQMKRSLQGIAVMTAAALTENVAAYGDNAEIDLWLSVIGESLEMVASEIERLTMQAEWHQAREHDAAQPLALLGWVGQDGAQS